MQIEGWVEYKGSEITTKITKGSSPKWQGFDYQNDGTLFVTSENVREGFLDISNPKYLSLEFNKKLKNSQLEVGDILINIVGASIGRSCQFNIDNQLANINQAVCLFRTNELVDKNYIQQYLQLPSTINRLLGTQTESARPNLSLGDLRDFTFILPPKSEQKKIAVILSTWDKAIEAVEKLVANSQQQKKALMQQLLTGQKRLLDENGVRFSEDWEFYKVKDIFISESLTAKEQNYPIYSVTKNGLINQADYFNKSVASEDTSKYRVVNRGRFVMSGLNFWMGSVDVHLEDFPVIVSPAYKVFSISKLTSPSFMKQFIKGSEFGKLLETSSVVGASVVRRNFSESIFKNYELFLPNREEQEKIAQVLTLADREIDLYKEQLDKLKLEKKSLMQQLLTGKKRVKVAA